MKDSVRKLIITDTDQLIRLISEYGIHRSVRNIKEDEWNCTDIYLGKLLEKDMPSSYFCFSFSIFCKEVLSNGQEGDTFHVLLTDSLAEDFAKQDVQVGDYVGFKGIRRVPRIETNFFVMKPDAELWACMLQKVSNFSQDSHNIPKRVRSNQSKIPGPSVKGKFEPWHRRCTQSEIPGPSHEEDRASETSGNNNFEPISHRNQEMSISCALAQQNTESDSDCESEVFPLNVPLDLVTELNSWFSLRTTTVEELEVTKLQDVTGDCNVTIICKVLSISKFDSSIHLLKLTDGTTVTSPVLVLNFDGSFGVRKEANNYVHVLVNEFSTCIEALKDNDIVKIQNIQVKSFLFGNPAGNQSTWCLAFKLSGTNTRIRECTFNEGKSLLKLLKHKPENTLDASICHETETNIQCGARLTTASEVPVRPSTSSSADCSTGTFQKILNHKFSYTVMAWIKHFNPVSTSEFIKVVCVSCKRYESTSHINDIKEKCEKCRSKGKRSSKLEVQFFVTLFLEDIKGNRIETLVCGDKAHQFFGCSTAEFLRSKSLQNDIKNTLKALVNKCNQKDLSGLAPVTVLPVLSTSEKFLLIVDTTLDDIKQSANV